MPIPDALYHCLVQMVLLGLSAWTRLILDLRPNLKVPVASVISVAYGRFRLSRVVIKIARGLL